MLLIPTSRGAHITYCDPFCAQQAEAPGLTGALLIASVDCLTCHHCGSACRGAGACAATPAPHACSRSGSSPAGRADAGGLSMALGAGGLTDVGWESAVELA